MWLSMTTLFSPGESFTFNLRCIDPLLLQLSNPHIVSGERRDSSSKRFADAW